MGSLSSLHSFPHPSPCSHASTWKEGGTHRVGRGGGGGGGGGGLKKKVAPAWEEVTTT
jgi:hypothetical protein